MKIWPGVVLLGVIMGWSGITNESFAAPACVCTLEWEASPDPAVAGYALYYAMAGAPMTNRLDVGMTTNAVVKGLSVAWSYDFYVVAYDANNAESEPSNLLPYTAKAISSLGICQPAGCSPQLSFHMAPGASGHVEYTDTLTPPVWHMLKTAIADSNGVVTINDTNAAVGSRFYRASVP